MNCKEGTQMLTDQVIELLDQIQNSQYKKPLPLFSGSSLGQHFRHILDFYNCLFQGINNNLIDYALRERKASVESDTEVAKSAIVWIQKQLRFVDTTSEILVVTDFNCNHDCNKVKVKSTIGRELMFAFDHTIHHLAMIKIGLKEYFPDVKYNEELGIAPSTVKHQCTGQLATE